MDTVKPVRFGALTGERCGLPNERVWRVTSTIRQRAVAELTGTALLVSAVVGSGIMGTRVFPDSDGLALLANTIATGAALAALIMTFGPISGAHFNPVVSIADASHGGLAWAAVPAYVGAQILGGLLGTLIAHGMFAAPMWLEASTRVRSGGPQLFSEFVASFGLMSVAFL